MNSPDSTRIPAPDTPESAETDALHALAQPLTSLSFILDIARHQSDPAVWHSALGDGLVEVRRAVIALEQLRSTLQDTPQAASPSPDSPGDKQ